MKKEVGKRSSMYVAISSRLLGLATTIFILILNIKSELLSSLIITSQLVLSIPLLLGSMLSYAKITDEDSLRKYYYVNRITTASAFGLLFNTMGLLISTYVSQTIGVIFFIGLLSIFSLMMFIDIDKKKIFNEGLTILIIIFLGLLPALNLY